IVSERSIECQSRRAWNPRISRRLLRVHRSDPGTERLSGMPCGNFRVAKHRIGASGERTRPRTSDVPQSEILACLNRQKFFGRNTIDLQWKIDANYNARPWSGERKAAGATTMAKNEKNNPQSNRNKSEYRRDRPPARVKVPAPCASRIHVSAAPLPQRWSSHFYRLSQPRRHQGRAPIVYPRHAASLVRPVGLMVADSLSENRSYFQY